jgi:hypothetical protein
MRNVSFVSGSWKLTSIDVRTHDPTLLSAASSRPKQIGSVTRRSVGFPSGSTTREILTMPSTPFPALYGPSCAAPIAHTTTNTAIRKHPRASAFICGPQNACRYNIKNPENKKKKPRTKRGLNN